MLLFKVQLFKVQLFKVDLLGKDLNRSCAKSIQYCLVELNNVLSLIRLSSRDKFVCYYTYNFYGGQQ